MLLRELASRAEFRCIGEELKKFRLFTTLGIQHKELVHSRIVSQLFVPGSFKSPKRDFSEKFTVNFLNMLRENHGISVEENSLTKRNVYTEYKNIDILINFFEKKLILAFENKINHVERERQIADYQQLIENDFPGHQKYIVFLTKDGKVSETAVQASAVKCLNVSYGEIHSILKGILSEESENQTDEIRFLWQFNDHLKEDIMGLSKIKEMCEELYRGFPRECWELVKNFPRLQGLMGVLGKEIDKSKFNLDSWGDDQLFIKLIGSPIENLCILLFLNYAENKLSIFVSTNQNSVRANKEEIERYFNETPYEVVKGWAWMCISRNYHQEILDPNLANPETIAEITRIVAGFARDLVAKVQTSIP